MKQVQMNDSMSKRCEKCGGYLFIPLHPADILCSCDLDVPKTSLTGWECPRCRQIHSPFKLTCDCSAPVVSATSFSDTPITKTAISQLSR